jgi:hypothetical protein
VVEIKKNCHPERSEGPAFADGYYALVSLLFKLGHCSASKSLAFAELHPYNPLTGIMLRRALLFDSPEMPVHGKDRTKKITEIKIAE